MISEVARPKGGSNRYYLKQFKMKVINEFSMVEHTNSHPYGISKSLKMHPWTTDGKYIRCNLRCIMTNSPSSCKKLVPKKGAFNMTPGICKYFLYNSESYMHYLYFLNENNPHKPITIRILELWFFMVEARGVCSRPLICPISILFCDNSKSFFDSSS